jgi:uncharacterized protein YqjF (DUF2071 family)
MCQTWGKLLFMHWPVSPDLLRPFIPERLAVDTHDGVAWIGIVPFTMWNVRASFLPPLPGLSAFHELNVRTYVHLNGVPGVWFFSLDAANRIAVRAAKWSFGLPYYWAEMELEQRGNKIKYDSKRREAGGGAKCQPELGTIWTIEHSLPETEPGSLGFFLTERYCLYSRKSSRLYRARIFHRPWPLRAATLESLRSSMLEPLGLTAERGEPGPLVHYAEELRVSIWAPKEV